MARAVIAGPRDKLPSVIETLHEMKLIHIIDHHGEDETFRIGKPLPPAAELAESLVKLRSVGSILAVKVPPGERATVQLDEVREEIQGRLDKLRERFAGFVVSAEEALEVEVEKAEAPLRFAVSEHSFVVDGWVPAVQFRGLQKRLSEMRIYAEAAEAGEYHQSEDPPVLLNN